MEAQSSVSVKACGVCGDVTKSFHFGGLSCNSCKAFFRRSVQNDVYEKYQCALRSACTITKSSRKSCQHCRMQRCLAIGMEKSWVMSDSERKALMKIRTHKKVIDDDATAKDNGSAAYKPLMERMVDYMSVHDIHVIEDVVSKYRYAFIKVPYRDELKHYNDDRPGVQVMEMFGTLIHRYAYYSRTIKDFMSLSFSDQSLLLKGGVLEMCLLRGALSFDPRNNCWPNIDMDIYANTPVLKLDNMKHMTSNGLFRMHMEFIASVQKMDVDEATIMLLILIILFTPERAGLQQPLAVAATQERYSRLLHGYVNWRYHPSKGGVIFAKLVTKLSDLRGLSDSHNHHNLQLRTEEIQKIREEMESLKLDPYPHMPLFQPEVDLPATEFHDENWSSAHQLHEQPQGATLAPSSAVDHVENDLLMEETMAASFMKEMHKSISQVVGTPHFGYVWVHPDYYDEQMDLAEISALTDSHLYEAMPHEHVLHSNGF